MRIGDLLDGSVTLTGKDVGGNGHFTFSPHNPAAEWQSGYVAGVEAAAKALEADAVKCDCFAYEENECACGSWADYKTITSARAVEIVRALVKETPFS